MIDQMIVNNCMNEQPYENEGKSKNNKSNSLLKVVNVSKLDVNFYILMKNKW